MANSHFCFGLALSLIKHICISSFAFRGTGGQMVTYFCRGGTILGSHFSRKPMPTTHLHVTLIPKVNPWMLPVCRSNTRWTTASWLWLRVINWETLHGFNRKGILQACAFRLMKQVLPFVDYFSSVSFNISQHKGFSWRNGFVACHLSCGRECQQYNIQTGQDVKAHCRRKQVSALAIAQDTWRWALDVMIFVLTLFFVDWDLHTAFQISTDPYPKINCHPLLLTDIYFQCLSLRIVGPMEHILKWHNTMSRYRKLM